MGHEKQKKRIDGYWVSEGGEPSYPSIRDRTGRQSRLVLPGQEIKEIQIEICIHKQCGLY